MKKVRVILTGGFLGAGKTTSIIKLATMLQEKGIKAGIITNDQGSMLVDGDFVKRNDIKSVEVTKGCFCCRFDDFLRGMNTLINEYDPDVLIAEPVGSCTDLISTVFMPLHKYYPERFILAPFSVVTDGLLLSKSLSNNDFPFTEDILYLFEKQIEEANLLLVNKIDILEASERQSLMDWVSAKYPDKIVFPVCALTGEGFEHWTACLLQTACNLNPLKEIDYIKYGTAELLLGWYNASISFNGALLFDPNDMVQDFLAGIADAVKNAGGKIAHLKVIAESDGGIMKASVVRTSVHFDRNAYDLTRKMELLINARVEMEPDLLRAIINEQIRKSCNNSKLEGRLGYEECFKPSFPTPTYKEV